VKTNKLPCQHSEDNVNFVSGHSSKLSSYARGFSVIAVVFSVIAVCFVLSDAFFVFLSLRCTAQQANFRCRDEPSFLQTKHKIPEVDIATISNFSLNNYVI